MAVDGMSLVNSLVDRYYVIKFISIAGVGIYYIGLQIGSVIALIALAINSAYVPLFFKKYESDDDNYDSIYKMGDLIVYFIGILGSILVIITPYLFDVLFTESYKEAKTIIIYLCFLSVMKSVYFLYTNILSLEVKLVRMKTAAILIGATVNIILGYYLTMHYKMIGAAISTLVSFTITTVLLIYLVRTKTDFNFNYKKQLSFVLSSFLISYVLISFELDTLISSIIIKFILLIIAFIIVISIIEYKFIKSKIYGIVNIQK
jgi:O-antigen/teichoic acid export membrane protein